LLVAPWALHAEEPRGLPNPFYAMDTAFQRPGLTTEQQLDVVKELGYAGIAWTETSPDQARAVAEQARKRGLRMVTIYCGARVTPEGDLQHSPQLDKLIAALKDHDTLIWLTIQGAGPKVQDLTGNEKLVQKLRRLADTAAASKLRVALYPHSGFWIADTAAAVKLARTVDRKNFGVTYNLIHSLWAGEEKEIPKLLEQAYPLLFSVTINGADATLRPGFRTPILTLDKGTYDVGIVLRKLKELGYTGPIGFQGYGIKGDTRSILTPTMRAWRKLSAQAAAGSK
jgi:sugar phosphate isomerase/epimerase